MEEAVSAPREDKNTYKICIDTREEKRPIYKIRIKPYEYSQWN